MNVLYMLPQNVSKWSAAKWEEVQCTWWRSDLGITRTKKKKKLSQVNLYNVFPWILGCWKPIQNLYNSNNQSLAKSQHVSSTSLNWIVEDLKFYRLVLLQNFLLLIMNEMSMNESSRILFSIFRLCHIFFSVTEYKCVERDRLCWVKTSVMCL